MSWQVWSFQRQVAFFLVCCTPPPLNQILTTSGHLGKVSRDTCKNADGLRKILENFYSTPRSDLSNQWRNHEWIGVGVRSRSETGSDNGLLGISKS